MLYIHIPYCKGKCIYCDFYSGGHPRWEKYLKAVASELTERIDELRGVSLSSIYIGGGTPSLIPAELFNPFVDNVFLILKEGGIEISPNLEFTIEINPEDVNDDIIASWKEAGVNRASVGMQSLNNDELRLLRRRHTREKSMASLAKLRRAFSNISVDLIYGIPGQKLESLKYSINNILQFQPEHISAYSLTYEEGTPLYLLREKHKLTECTEDQYLQFDSFIQSFLEKAGYERYEISNYSLPGKRSRHNSGYWDGRPYIGLGPSASSYDGKSKRRTNHPDLKRYMEGENNHYSEDLTPEEQFEELVMISLRTREGLPLAKLSRSRRQTIMDKAEPWLKSGKLSIETGGDGAERLTLTKSGIFLSDAIILSLV